MGKTSQRAKINQIEAEDNGEVLITGEDAPMDPTGECPVGEDEILVVVDVDQVDLIPWRAIGAGCVVIWPETVPAPLRSR